MSVLLLGAGGMLATDIARTAPAGALTAALSRAEADITDPTAIGAVLDRFRPQWVINAAAYTAVDRAETEYATAVAVNGTAVGTLGRLCAARNTCLLHFSTDYIFPGDGPTPYDEDAPASPVNAYGRSKLIGERELMGSGARNLILRVQWLFGEAGRSFPRTMWQRARSRQETRVVDDQWGRPTSTIDVARVTWSLIERNSLGVYHAANEGTATWFDVAAAVFEACGSDALRRCRTDDYPTPARRPGFSVLDTSKLHGDHGLRLPHWRDSLRSFVASLERQAATGQLV